MNEHKDTFESLNNYVSEQGTLFEADDKPIGNIIDKALSFVPRAARFKKAKKIMSKSRNNFIKKANKLITKFSGSFDQKVAHIDAEYKQLKNGKIAKLLADGKEEQAAKVMETQRKELEQYTKEQQNILDKGIENILNAYTQAIDKRIDTPGFIFNVELSEKGKGNLKAKWQEIIAHAQIDIDTKKTALMRTTGYKRLNDIMIEMTTFVDERSHMVGGRSVDFYIKKITPASRGYNVTCFLRLTGFRPIVQEKGYIWGADESKLELNTGASTVKDSERTVRWWTSLIPSLKPTDFIRPYMVVTANKKTFTLYGDITDVESAIVEPDKTKEPFSGEERVQQNK